MPMYTIGTGEPGGLPSMGSHRIGHDWSNSAAAAAAAAAYYSSSQNIMANLSEEFIFYLDTESTNMVTHTHSCTFFYTGIQHFLK